MTAMYARAMMRALASASTSSVACAATKRAGRAHAVVARGGPTMATTTTSGATNGGVARGAGRRCGANTGASGAGQKRAAIEDFINGGSSSGAGGGALYYAERRAALMALSGINPGSRLQLALAKIAMYEARDELGVLDEEEEEDT